MEHSNSVDRSMQTIEELRQRYARLAVEVGVGPQPGQGLYIWKAPVKTSAFVRQVAEEAYCKGAPRVGVFWSDDELRRLRLLQSFNHVCVPLIKEVVDYMVAGAVAGAFLFFPGQSACIQRCRPI